MARFCCFTQFLLLFFAAYFLISESSLVKVPQNQRAAGVFLLTDGGKYTLNFTAATAACLFLNITIATRAQMERAIQQGLETCKFGWIQEKIAVVPRLKSDKNCGQGKTGVVPWFASEDKKFGVFCFNASDIEEAPKTSTACTQTSTSSTTLTALTQTSTYTTALVKSTPRFPLSRTPITANTPEQTSFTSAFTLLVKTIHSARTSSMSSSLKPFSTSIPTSLPHLTTSKPSVISMSILTALIILGIILLLLTAAGAVWYYKLNIFTIWSQGQQKDNTETEMWKHTDSEMDLYSQHGEEEEEEELDIKYSSEIMLCVNPDIKTNSSE